MWVRGPPGARQIILLSMSDKKKTPGPKPETVKIEGDWEDAVSQALAKKRPVGGWPEPDSEESEKSSESDDSDSHSKP